MNLKVTSELGAVYMLPDVSRQRIEMALKYIGKNDDVVFTNEYNDCLYLRARVVHTVHLDEELLWKKSYNTV